MDNRTSGDRGWLWAKEKTRSEIWEGLEIPDWAPPPDEDSSRFFHNEWFNITTGVALLLTYVVRGQHGTAGWALYRFKIGEVKAYDLTHFLRAMRIEDAPERWIRGTHDLLIGDDAMTRNDPV